MSIALFCSCSSKKVVDKVVQSISDNNSLFYSTDVDSYVGFVNRYYFQKTDEFYVDLYFKRANIENDEYSRIANSGDSTIFKDDENQRTRIPLKIAVQEFDFRGLETLSLYDKNNRFLTNAHFVRVEYLDQNISPVFTAVYKADKPSLTDRAIYCVGNQREKNVAYNYISFDDSLLTKKIAQKMRYTHKYTLDGKHYRDNENSCISMINLDDTVLIVEKKDDTYDCLYQSKQNENMIDLLIVPIIRNLRPIILTKSVKPETDIEWNDLLIFDGKRYQTSDRQKL